MIFGDLIQQKVLYCGGFNEFFGDVSLIDHLRKVLNASVGDIKSPLLRVC